jgi:excisionase family DNA binding protein
MAETVTMREAAERLGVSNTKIWRLVKDGVLPVQRNPLDGRQKLVRVADLERLADQTQVRRRFVSDGIVNVPDAPRAAEIEDYLREHWRA